MVERQITLDLVFGGLSDSTRRDILRRVSKQALSVSEIARHYAISFAAVAKHLHVLEQARLVTKTRRGKEQIVTLSPAALSAAGLYLKSFEEMWEKRLDTLEIVLKTRKETHGTHKRSQFGKSV